uniref:EIF4E2 n=2 Tax=Pan TaxID=9596 RepID=A0A2I3SBC9_PANTR
MNNKFDALKDDNNRDHDQNEESSTQKDTEKEKTQWDKNKSSNKRKAVVPGQAEHPLQYNYTFWYSRRTPGCPTSSQSYEQNIKQIGTFASVEQFWRFYSHMDNANKNGDKRIIWLRKGLIPHCWENLILAMLGEKFMVGEEICGAVVSLHCQEDIISIWKRLPVTKQPQLLNLSPNTIMKYKTHTDSIKTPCSLGSQRLLYHNLWKLRLNVP